MTTSECDLTAENSLDLFQFEGSLHNWAFDDTENMINKIFLKFKTTLLTHGMPKTFARKFITFVHEP